MCREGVGGSWCVSAKGMNTKGIALRKGTLHIPPKIGDDMKK
ncbi:MAG: hypothetical protein U9O90_07605 [Euryarchaeota archaeon]|nr:hypothetical protein [Euryarchaeota archaeon]